MYHKIFCYHQSNGFFWFRVFGYGMHFKNIQKHRPLFSERYGYKKVLKIGHWAISILKP